MNAVETAAELEQTVEQSRATLLAISDEAASGRAEAGSWSKKEILGHLIDSASNNHQRFVRLQHVELLVMPSYQQNEWVRTQNYQARSWQELVELWIAYNRHLAHIIRHADHRAAGHIWRTPGKDYTFDFLVEDYLKHMRHHLTQLAGDSAVA